MPESIEDPNSAKFKIQPRGQIWYMGDKPTTGKNSVRNGPPEVGDLDRKS
jgi:hypothetical protein